MDWGELTKDIWPQERDFIERPERYRYVRKLIKAKNCVFCDIAQSSENSFENLCLYRSAHSMVVLNKFPYNNGHVLVIPLKHCAGLEELSLEAYHDLNQQLLLALKAVKSVYSCEGLNLGMNYGKVAGAGIPDHLHWHVVPRWVGDTNFFPLIGETKVLPETLEQSYSKLRSFFEEREKE